MASYLLVMFAKNLRKRIVLLQLIIENVVTCFLEDSVAYNFSQFAIYLKLIKIRGILTKF